LSSICAVCDQDIPGVSLQRYVTPADALTLLAPTVLAFYRQIDRNEVWAHVFAHYTACVRFPTQERGEAHLRHGTWVLQAQFCSVRIEGQPDAASSVQPTGRACCRG